MPVLGVRRPIGLNDNSELQPDLSLHKPPAERYVNQHPAASDILLIVEVSESSLRYDREIKLPLYARHGIPEFWLIDVTSKTLQCMRDPQGEAYASAITCRDGNVQLAALPDVVIHISGVLSF